MAKQYIHFQLTLLLGYSCKFITSKLPQTFSSHTGRWDILSQTCKCVKFENVSLVQFMHLVSICIPDRSYHRQFKFLLLWCDVFQTLITSLCWLCLHGHFAQLRTHPWKEHLLVIFCTIYSHFTDTYMLPGHFPLYKKPRHTDTRTWHITWTFSAVQVATLTQASFHVELRRAVMKFVRICSRDISHVPVK